MTVPKSYIKGKHILAVDDEQDILETIADILEDARVDRAGDYATASRKIKEKRYDLAILDIMGVNGLQLLEEAVDRGIPTVMLTAHAINPETLMESIRKGAISYLPKEMLAELELPRNCAQRTSCSKATTVSCAWRPVARLPAPAAAVMSWARP